MKRQRRLLLHKARISLLVLMQLFTYAAYADDDASQPSTPELSADFIPKEGDGSLFNWLPGETYDPRTSTLGYYVTDMHVPGNGGLDIVVNRKFKMRANEPTRGDERYPELFGSMSLDLPRIEYTTWETGSFTSGCEGLFVYNYKKFDDPKQLVSGLTFHVNNTSVSFYPKHLDNSSASRFPATADYVSDKNWYIECAGPVKGAFDVHAPNGTVYRLTAYEQHRSKFLHPRLTSTPGVHSTIEPARKKTVFVSKITDVNNNSLTYTYHDEITDFYGRSITQKVLGSIVSSDGRTVVISHRDNVGANCPKLINSITYDNDPSKTVSYVYDAIGVNFS